MISGINNTLTTALALWQSMPSPTAADQPTSLNTQKASGSTVSSTKTPINEIAAILAASNAQKGNFVGYRSVMSAYASETISTASASINITTSATVATPDVITQIKDAVSTVNNLLKASPSNTSGTQASTSDVIVVSPAGLNGSAPVSYQLDLPEGATQPTDMLGALQVLSKSGNAGVASAALDLASRFVSEQKDGLTYWNNANSPHGDLNTVADVAQFVMSNMRDSQVSDLASSLIKGDTKDIGFSVGFLSATYNGSFALVNLHESNAVVQATETDPNALGSRIMAGLTFGSSHWALVLPTETVQTSVSITATTKS